MSEERRHDGDDRSSRFGELEIELPSGKLLTRATSEDFLTPSWEEYRWANFEYLDRSASYPPRDRDRRLSLSARSKDELMKVAIALALATLELAEAELIDKLNVAYLDRQPN
jgi:hypothetical protein